VRSALGPEAMLAVLLEVEAQLGRVRQERWGPRVLDLDLLWGPEPHASAALALPHAGLSQRWFALAPLLDVARTLGEEAAAESLELSSALRSRYAPGLAALGGAPVEGAPFGRGPRARISRLDGVQLEVQAPLEDALAAVLLGLGELSAPAQPCAPVAVHVVRTARDIDSALAGAFALLRSGLAIRHASVSADLSSVRLIGAPGLVTHARLEAIEVADVSEREVRLRVACRLD
jgi:hypothetical protein